MERTTESCVNMAAAERERAKSSVRPLSFCQLARLRAPLISTWRAASGGGESEEYRVGRDPSIEKQPVFDLFKAGAEDEGLRLATGI